MSDELLRLADRIESMTGPSVDADAEIALAIGQFSEAHYGMWHEYVMEGHSWPDDEPVPVPPNSFTASLDAAMTLVPEGWTWCIPGLCRPKWDARIIRKADGMVRLPLSQPCATPALSLTAASLRARASRLRMEVE